MSKPQAARRGAVVPSPRSAVAPASWLRRALRLPGESRDPDTRGRDTSGADRAGDWDVPAPPRCTHDLHEDVGAYVLGALGDADARRFETHLASCPACPRELDDLLGVRMLLDSVDPAVVTHRIGH